MNLDNGGPNTYIQFPDEIQDRIDFSHNHPDLEVVDQLDSVTSYNTAELGDKVGDQPVIENIVSGTTPKGVDYLDEGVYFLGAGNVQQNWLELDDISLISESVHENTLSSSQLNNGDVLVTMAGTIGRSCVYDLDEPANINQAIAKIKVNSDILNPYYLSLYLNSTYGQKAFQKYRHDVSQPNINTEEIQRIPIILPSVEAQEEIASSAKSTIDDAFSLRNQKSELLDKATNKFLRQIGIDIPKRKPMFFKEQRTPTDVYSHPLEPGIGTRFEYLFHHPNLDIASLVDDVFKLTTLESQCQEEIHRGTQPDYEEDGEVLVIKTAELKSSYIDYNSMRYVSEEFYQNNPQSQVKFGDILVSSTGLGSLGKVDMYNKNEKAVVDGHVSIVRPIEEYDPRFLVFYLRSYLGKVQFEKWFNGSSGQIELTPNDLGKFKIPVKESFDLETQKEISDCIQNEFEAALDIDDELNDILDTMMNQFEETITID